MSSLRQWPSKCGASPAWPLRRAPSCEARSGADAAVPAAAAAAGGDGADAANAIDGDGAAPGPLAGAGARASSATKADASALRAKRRCKRQPMAAASGLAG